jgi:hypothetical protein
MTYVEYYQAKAEKCERQAETDNTDNKRLLEIPALEWREIAAKLERRLAPSQTANG